MVNYDAILLRFGELFLKGKNRKMFITRLINTVKQRLIDFPQTTLNYSNDSATIYLNGADSDALIKQLHTVFGIQSYGLCFICKPSIDEVSEACCKHLQELYEDGTRVRFTARRAEKNYPLTSIEIGQHVAKVVDEKTAIIPVVQDPQATVKIQIRKADALILCKQIAGLGGMPVGTAGKTMLMLSGGIDSPVAAYLLMKRGLMIEALHFESPPHTSVQAKQKVFDLAEKLAAYMPNRKITVHSVPFTDLQKAIFRSVPESYGMTVMRRMMYRIAANYAESRGVSILSNGESLGQVASQTAESMAAINAVTALPVIRPVCCMDKSEIMSLARDIDTYEISIRPHEDCCTVFVPPNPATTPKAERCEEYERRFEWEPLLNRAVEDISKTAVRYGKPIHLDMETTEEICGLL